MSEFFLRLQGNTIDELPSAPSNLQIIETYNRECVLTWTNNHDSVGEYNVIQLWDTRNLKWVTQEAILLSAETYNLEGLSPNTDYKVRVAVLLNGSYFPSLVTEFTTTNLQEPIPSAVTVDSYDHESATISWQNNPVLGIGEWNEAYLYDSDGTTLLQSITGMSLTATTCTFTGLTQDHTYIIKVAVRDEILVPEPASVVYYTSAINPDFTTNSVAVEDFRIKNISYDGLDYRVRWENYDPSGETTWHKYVWMTQNYVDYTYQEVDMTAMIYIWRDLSEGAVKFGLVTVDGEIPTGVTTYYTGSSIYEVMLDELTVVPAKTFGLDTSYMDEACQFTPTSGSIMGAVEQCGTKHLWVFTYSDITHHGDDVASGCTILNYIGAETSTLPITLVGNTKLYMFSPSQSVAARREILVLPVSDAIRSFNGTAVSGAFRIDGISRTVDTGFNGGWFLRDTGGKALVKMDETTGDIYTHPTSGGDEQKKIIKYDFDGVLDTGFTLTMDKEIIAICLDSLYIYVAEPYGEINRYHKIDGSQDMSYNTHNADVGYIRAMIILPDGKLLVGGTGGNRMSLWNTDGTSDSTLQGKEGEVNDFILQSDGKIIVIGNHIRYDGMGESHNHIIRLNSDFSYDNTTFQGLLYPYNEIYENRNRIYLGDGNKLYGVLNGELQHNEQMTGYYHIVKYKYIS